MKNKEKKVLIPYEIIVKAVNSDVDSINEVLGYFEGYINYLSTRKMYDEFGQTHYKVDEYMKRRLETKLITEIVKMKSKHIQETAI